ncbi:MAG TPA: hypothetical protein ENJ05_06180 [Thiotrichales bacterium]|nr:hypothetical protein [Thiotrichales bacterium]
MDQEQILEKVLEVVRADTHGAASLTLFALMKTMSTDNGQYLFLLNKLKDISPDMRELAYGLMELMAQGRNQAESWNRTLSDIESAIRNG